MNLDSMRKERKEDRKKERNSQTNSNVINKATVKKLDGAGEIAKETRRTVNKCSIRHNITPAPQKKQERAGRRKILPPIPLRSHTAPHLLHITYFEICKTKYWSESRRARKEERKHRNSKTNRIRSEQKLYIIYLHLFIYILLILTI
ncbi:MAG: hypothetical protein J3K34DRAFT_395218 [Monoraphidium minutum]|nr:MAG: hypothetical protein J3K34DRAFT_395218 [Monoraphidium minutum]